MEKIIIGGHAVDEIGMLDSMTCYIYFEAFKEGKCLVDMIVEKWLDEDEWHFTESYFDEEGNFLGTEKATHLSEEDKKACKNVIERWISENLKKP